MRGAKRIPDEVLNLRGSGETNRRDRRTPPPVKAITTLAPPEPLTGECQLLWDGCVRFLADAGVLAQIHGPVLLRYVRMLNDFQKIDGATTDVREAIHLRTKLSAHLSRLEAAFGMTPGDRRALIPADKPEPKKDPLAELMDE